MNHGDVLMDAKIDNLKKRSSYKAVAAHGVRYVSTAFILQVGKKMKDTPDMIRFGFTTSRKVGGAVERNRVRRQLKELARQVIAPHIERGRDYVLVGRRRALKTPFQAMVLEAQKAMRKLKVEL